MSFGKFNGPTLSVYVEVRVDGATPATFECVEDRGLIDIWPTKRNYARVLSMCVEDHMQEAVRAAILNARKEGRWDV